MLNVADLARVLRAAADECDRIAVEHRAERRDWTDQSASPLGRRRHVNAVRRRITRSEGGAAVAGRRYLLSVDALAEELERTTSTTPESDKPASVADELRRELRLVGRGPS